MERTGSRTRGGLGGGFVLFLMVPLLGCAATKPPAAHAKRETPKATNPQVLETYGKLPLAFEPNQGQTDSQVQFLSRGAGYTLFLTPTEAVLALREPQAQANTLLRMRLVGANPAPQVTGLGELPGKVNSFIGNDPTRWRTNIPTYSKVEYQQVYPGVNLVYYGNQRQLEYDFVVSPGADPRAITLAFEGMDGVAIDALGDLVLRADAGEVRLRKPVVYQDRDGQRTVIPTRYVIKGERQVAFEVAAYDRTQALIIDPVLIYSTFLGGFTAFHGAEAWAIAVDGDGNAYITGETTPAGFPTFPTTADPIPPPLPRGFADGISDAFVAKLNRAGTALVYSTHLGGRCAPGVPFFECIDRGLGISVDSSGNAYVTGATRSVDFPTKNPLQPDLRGGTDAFVAKLNPEGSDLVYSTYLGGSSHDQAAAIAVGVEDGSVHAYVTGETLSFDFPLANPLQPAHAGIFGSTDGFVAKLNAAGSALVYSTYLGGSGRDEAAAVAVGVDADGSVHAYVTGSTQSVDFPISGNFPVGGNPPMQRYCDHPVEPPTPPSVCRGDAFVAKLNPNASGAASLVYSTYLGGSGKDEGSGIAVWTADGSVSAYVTGNTSSPHFPLEGAFPTRNAFQVTCDRRPLDSTACNGDAFVAKLNPAGNGPADLVYSTYLGGTLIDHGLDISVDSSGNAYVTGQTHSGDFPTATSLQGFGGGSNDAFVVKLRPGFGGREDLIYSTSLGGSADEAGRGIAVDAAGNAYVTGFTSSHDFPRESPLQPRDRPLEQNFFGFNSAFVAKLGSTAMATGFSTDRGVFANLSGVSEATLPVAGKPLGVSFPFGFFDWTVAGLTPGQAIEVTMTFPTNIPSGARYFKVINGLWTDATSLLGDDDGDNVLTLTITDGGFGDADGAPNGQISDPGGVATVEVTNQPPVANAGPDQTVECSGQGGTQVTLNGSLSSDPNNGDLLTYTWRESASIIAGPSQTRTSQVSLGLGSHNITLTVADGNGGTASDSVEITVADTTAPIIGTVTATPNVLSPPNHRMVPVTVAAAVADVCDAAPRCKILEVTSNEPVTGLGRRDRAPDWDIGPGPLQVNLRAERSGRGTGRIYTITVQCTDVSRNSAPKTLTVTVPHGRGRATYKDDDEGDDDDDRDRDRPKGSKRDRDD